MGVVYKAEDTERENQWTERSQDYRTRKLRAGGRAERGVASASTGHQSFVSEHGRITFQLLALAGFRLWSAK
jgi:hypothetical protein